ncbi:MAG: hypothetical protein LIO71_10450 [Ruminococcus sp.]|nr:hypothetical protein [Ruminococcus sp.]MCD7800822.1 hypothetical protein [Ruminococcus sp.]
MKKILTYITISIIFMLNVSCTELKNDTTINSSTMKVGIVDETFSMSVPEEYTETSSEYIDKYFTKDDTASIIFTKDSDVYQYDNANEYYSNAISQYKETFYNVQEISSEVVTVSGIYNAQIVEFSYEIYSESNVIDMTCYVEYILTGNTVYIVTCSAPTDKYSNYRNDFVQSIDSISINR